MEEKVKGGFIRKLKKNGEDSLTNNNTKSQKISGEILT